MFLKSLDTPLGLHGVFEQMSLVGMQCSSFFSPVAPDCQRVYPSSVSGLRSLDRSLEASSTTPFLLVSGTLSLLVVGKWSQKLAAAKSRFFTFRTCMIFSGRLATKGGLHYCNAHN